MLHHLGILLQLIALTGLPLLVIFQLNFGFQLIWMPAMTLVGIVLFTVGYFLRERDSR